MSRLADDKGFSLLEVVVSVAIFSAAIAVLFPVFSSGMQRTDATDGRALGLAIARSLMEEQLAVEDWGALPKTGETGGWAWRVDGATYSHDTDSPEDADYLYRVSVEMTPPSVRYGTAFALERIVVRRD